MPNFTKDIRVRVDLLDDLTEITPKCVIDFVGDVESPAIDSEFFDPVTSDVEQVRLYFIILGIEFRHLRYESKRIVVR